MRPSYEETYFRMFSFPSICHDLSKHQPCKLTIMLRYLEFVGYRVTVKGQIF